MAQIEFLDNEGEELGSSIDLAVNPHLLEIEEGQEWTLVTECGGVTYEVYFIGGRPKKRS
jgi:hypothetical protein